MVGLNTVSFTLADGEHSSRTNLGPAATQCTTPTGARYSGCAAGGVNPHDGRGTPSTGATTGTGTPAPRYHILGLRGAAPSCLHDVS